MKEPDCAMRLFDLENGLTDKIGMVRRSENNEGSKACLMREGRMYV